MQSKKPILLGFGLIVLVLAWYGLTRPDTATVATEVAGQVAEAATTERLVGVQVPAADIVVAELSGNVPPAPEADIGCVQHEPPPFSDPTRDGRFESEPVDRAWAIQTESTLWSIAGSLAQVKFLQCRTTFCMVTFEHSNTVRDLDAATRRAQARDKINLLDETMRGLIASSDGRLGHYACRSVRTPFEGFEFDFYVYGPPKAVAE